MHCKLPYERVHMHIFTHTYTQTWNNILQFTQADASNLSIQLTLLQTTILTTRVRSEAECQILTEVG